MGSYLTVHMICEYDDAAKKLFDEYMALRKVGTSMHTQETRARFEMLRYHFRAAYSERDLLDPEDEEGSEDAPNPFTRPADCYEARLPDAALIDCSDDETPAYRVDPAKLPSGVRYLIIRYF